MSEADGHAWQYRNKDLSTLWPDRKIPPLWLRDTPDPAFWERTADRKWIKWTSPLLVPAGNCRYCGQPLVLSQHEGPYFLCNGPCNRAKLIPRQELFAWLELSATEQRLLIITSGRAPLDLAVPTARTPDRRGWMTNPWLYRRFDLATGELLDSQYWGRCPEGRDGSLVMIAPSLRLAYFAPVSQPRFSKRKDADAQAGTTRPGQAASLPMPAGAAPDP